MLQVTLPTNFKAARFESDDHTAMLRRMQADIDRWVSYYKPALMTTTNGVLGGITINGQIDPAKFDAGIAELKKAVEFLAGRIAGVPNGQPFRVPCP